MTESWTDVHRDLGRPLVAWTIHLVHFFKLGIPGYRTFIGLSELIAISVALEAGRHNSWKKRKILLVKPYQKTTSIRSQSKLSLVPTCTVASNLPITPSPHVRRDEYELVFEADGTVREVCRQQLQVSGSIRVIQGPKEAMATVLDDSSPDFAFVSAGEVTLPL